MTKDQQVEIHEGFGKTLAWNELPNHQSCWISLDKEAADLLDEDDWFQQDEWLPHYVVFVIIEMCSPYHTALCLQFHQNRQEVSIYGNLRL